jgi:hypothetical protein
MATYPAPDARGNPIFNPIQYHTIGTSGQTQTGTGITQAEADARYLFLGQTQGTEQFEYNIQVNKGSLFNQTTAQPNPLTINYLGKTSNLTIDPAYNLNITNNTFGAGLVIKDTANNVLLKPTNTGVSVLNYTSGAVAGLTCGDINCTDINISGTGIAVLGPADTFQTFLNYNTFQGTNASQAATSPLTITNSDTGLYSSFYQDHNNNDQLTIQSNTPLGGLTLRNASGNSFTVYPAGVNNAATFINPVNVLNYGVTCADLTLSSGGQSTVFTTSVSGLAINDSITVSGGGAVNCASLVASNSVTAQGGDLLVGGKSTLSQNSNLQGASFSTAGLYIGRNLEVGQNEFDIIAYNPTTTTALNIYGSQTTAISQASVPIISITNGTALLNGVEIATTNGTATARTNLTYIVGGTQLSTPQVSSNLISSSSSTIYASNYFYLYFAGTSIGLTFNQALYNGTFQSQQVYYAYFQNTTNGQQYPATVSLTQNVISLTSATTLAASTNYYFVISLLIVST